MTNQGNQTSAETSNEASKKISEQIEKFDDHLTSDDDEHAGHINRNPYMSRAEAEVRENEDASLQDDTYTFDPDNTYSDEGIDDFDVEDAGGGLSDFDIDNDDDFV